MPLLGTLAKRLRHANKPGARAHQSLKTAPNPKRQRSTIGNSKYFGQSGVSKSPHSTRFSKAHRLFWHFAKWRPINNFATPHSRRCRLTKSKRADFHAGLPHVSADAGRRTTSGPVARHRFSKTLPLPASFALALFGRFVSDRHQTRSSRTVWPIRLSRRSCSSRPHPFSPSTEISPTKV
jgi:hypothetical protein